MWNVTFTRQPEYCVSLWASTQRKMGMKWTWKPRVSRRFTTIRMYFAECSEKISILFIASRGAVINCKSFECFSMWSRRYAYLIGVTILPDAHRAPCTRTHHIWIILYSQHIDSTFYEISMLGNVPSPSSYSYFSFDRLNGIHIAQNAMCIRRCRRMKRKKNVAPFTDQNTAHE